MTKMIAREGLNVQEKALQINLSREIYGSFAEIGAGQEVAANFFRAGGASGTIAKTMSAYDMKFSDAIYGKGDRYVSEGRLIRMLSHEYPLLIQRLPHLVNTTRFFAFANTVETLNFGRTNQGHGWIGIRFQKNIYSEPNDCVVHIKMFDHDPLRQQYVLGVIGVNMIYACMFIDDPEKIMLSLTEKLNFDRVEVDMFRLSGPDFEDVDNRLMALKLVKNGLTKVALFGPDGEVIQPSEALYKRNVLLLRGRFRPVTHVNVDMLLASRRQFISDPEVDKEKLLVLNELTLNDLKMGGDIDEQDFLCRADILCLLGQTVLISNYFEYYRIAEYLSTMNKGRKIAIIMGIYALEKVFEEDTYSGLRGGILESFSKLFEQNIRLYVYPSLKKDVAEAQTLYTLADFEEKLPDKLKPLLRYLSINNKMEAIHKARVENLSIISDNVLEMIHNKKEGWEKYVPSIVEKAIKRGGLFGYSESKDKATQAVDAKAR